MAAPITPLTDIKCRQAKHAHGGKNKLFDGGGLYLELMASGAKKWRLKFRQPNGKENRLTFGDYPTVSLQEARNQRKQAKQFISEGRNPAIEREVARQATIQAQGDTFQAIAKEWLSTKKSGWSDGYYKRVRNALNSNAYPYIGKLPLSDLSGLLILGVVQRVEKRGALEMASRVLEAIGMVLNYATGTGRIKSNPADGLSQFLKERPPVKHFPHVQNTDLPGMLHKIEHYAGRPETVAAMKLMMRTFPRTNELRWAEWGEFDFAKALWTIPPERMKGTLIAKQYGSPHLVPLSKQVLTLLKDLQRLTGRHRFLFPGMRNPSTTPMSAETINKALEIMGYKDEQTGHGFRGLASTLLNEAHLFRKEAIDTQLAHKNKDKVEGAYNHAQYLPERRKIMQWWSDYLDEQQCKASS